MRHIHINIITIQMSQQFTYNQNCSINFWLKCILFSHCCIVFKDILVFKVVVVFNVPWYFLWHFLVFSLTFSDVLFGIFLKSLWRPLCPFFLFSSSSTSEVWERTVRHIYHNNNQPTILWIFLYHYHLLSMKSWV